MTTYCSVCDDPICEGDFIENRVADHHVLKCGELDCIELAHLSCALAYNDLMKCEYWTWTPTFTLELPLNSR